MKLGGVFMAEDFSLSLINNQKKRAMEQILACNSFTEKFGLMLSAQQVICLVERRFTALQDNGRIELGDGILKLLIQNFCDSPYIFQDNYEETLVELQDSFYYFKNECDDRFSDEELISFMKKYFDGVCQGSLEYLSETSLEELCRYARYIY